MIVKRDGHSVNFDRIKIKKAILMAFNAAGEVVIDEVDTMTDVIVGCLLGSADDAIGMGEVGISVSAVADCTESVLMDYGYTAVAANYMQYRRVKDAERKIRLSPDTGKLSDYITYSKYAASGETWSDCIHRVRDMHIRKYVGLGDSVTDFVDNVTVEDYRNGLKITDNGLKITDTGDGSSKTVPACPAGGVTGRQDGSIGLGEGIHKAIHRTFSLVEDKVVLPSMRSLQFGGRAAERNNYRMYNCSFTKINRVSVFGRVMHRLLSGCGVGYSVQRHHVSQLGVVGTIDKGNVVHWAIEDSIEGWATAVDVLLGSYLGSGDGDGVGRYIEFSYHLIRGEGSPLSSGGTAPGHMALKTALESVRLVLDGSVGRQMRPIECHDILCFLAEAVLSGGIRRSAMISLFSWDDGEMMYAKTKGLFDPSAGVNGHRVLANNSCVLLRDDPSLVEKYRALVALAASGFGEPGYFVAGSTEEGTNPCAEIVFPDVGDAFGYCNLVEINVCAIERLCNKKILRSVGSLGDGSSCSDDGSSCSDDGSSCSDDGSSCSDDGGSKTVPACPAGGVTGSPAGSPAGGVGLGDLKNSVSGNSVMEEVLERIADAAGLLAVMQSGYVETMDPADRDYCMGNRLLGVSLTGVMDTPGFSSYSVLRDMVVAACDKWCGVLGFSLPRSYTCIKPSGTASLLLGGVSSGCHAQPARRYIRRIRLGDSGIDAWIRRMWPGCVEDGMYLIVPIGVGDSAVLDSDVMGVGFLERVIALYRDWVTVSLDSDRGKVLVINSVSCTATVPSCKCAADEMVSFIADHLDVLRCLSFVPEILGGYKYLPREEIKDVVVWNRLCRVYNEMDLSGWVDSGLGVSDRGIEPACAGGACLL